MNEFSELNVFLFITNICVILLCGTFLPIAPMLTRKSFLFGVKVPPEAQDTDEAKVLKRDYIASTIIGVTIVLAASVLQYMAAPDYTVYAVMFFPLLLIAVQFAAFVPKHGRALELKSRLGWSVAEITYADTKTSFTRGNLSAMPHLWYIISLLLVFASFFVALARYPVLPDLIPISPIWDFNLGPTNWLPKSLDTVLLMPCISMGLVAVTWFSGTRIERAKLQIDHKEPVKSFAQHKKYRRLMGHGMGILAVALSALVFILGLQIAYPGFAVPIWLIVAIPLAASLLTSAIPIMTGQGGSRLKVNVTETPVAGGDTAGNNTRNDDKYWAWGLFYHNPNDPACFVESRFGGNIGPNYARLPVKIGVAIGVAAFAVCYVWVIVLARTLI